MAGSKPTMYNFFKEKFVMQEEEKVLKEMLGKFQDQLNRLKIEELALMSQLKMQEEQSKTSAKSIPEKTTAGSLDSISDTASNASVIPIGLMYENTSEVNKEYLDLNVDFNNLQGHLNDFEEEEEYDLESGDDMEEDEEIY
jgi:hypothetical protein